MVHKAALCSRSQRKRRGLSNEGRVGVDLKHDHKGHSFLQADNISHNRGKQRDLSYMTEEEGLKSTVACPCFSSSISCFKCHFLIGGWLSKKM